MKIVLSALWASSVVAVAGCVGVNTRRLLLSSGRLEQVGILILIEEKSLNDIMGLLSWKKENSFSLVKLFF